MEPTTLEDVEEIYRLVSLVLVCFARRALSQAGVAQNQKQPLRS